LVDTGAGTLFIKYLGGFEMEDSSFYNVSSDDYTRELKDIAPSSILIPLPSSSSRVDTEKGLGASVRDFGVLSPIDVMTSDEEGKYILVSGFRRLRAALAYQKETIPAYVWDFKDKDRGSDLRTILGLEINRTERRTWKEKWNMYQVLQDCDVDVPYEGRERLLDMEPGDSHKLEDVMGSNSFDEVRDALLNGEKDLDGAFKLLLKLRKEQNRNAIEEEQGASSIGAEDMEDGDGQVKLSDAEVDALIHGDIDDDLGEDDFGEATSGLFDSEHQTVGERHPVDPAIKQGTFQRDNYKCVCCGTGGVVFLGALVYHHQVPVHAGGPDTIENGLTICQSCHMILHVCERQGGKIPMTREQYEEYDKQTQERIQKIVHYARVAVKSALAHGVSQEDIRKEADAKSRYHAMPGAGLKENQAGFAASQKQKEKTDG